MDQRRMLLGVALSVVLLILYQEFVISRYTRPQPGSTPPSAEVTQEPAANQEPSPNPPTAAEPAAVEVAPTDGGEVTVETDVFTARVGLRGGCLRSLQLKKFRHDVSAESGALELVREDKVPAFPLTALLGGAGSDANVLYTAEPRELSVTGGDEITLTLHGTGPAGGDIEKQLIFRGGRYDFGVKISVTGTPAREIGLVMVAPPQLGGGSSRQAPDQAIALTEGRIVERKSAELPKDVVPDNVIRDVTWAGFAAQYFIAVGIPGEHQPTRAELVAVEPPKNPTSEQPQANRREGDGSQSALPTPVVRLRSETPDGRASFGVFIGPKSRELLSAAGHDLNRALDFGWFWFIAVPLLEALRLIDRLTGNYGVAIILLTGAVKLVTVPLTRSTFRNMSAMRKLQPQIEAARTRHKDDQVAQQREIMELYRRHGLNPLSGCLPMFLQLPVFVGLYNAISHAIELRHAPFLLWITDLSAPDRLVIGGIGIPVLTLLMGASMLVQQWMTPQQGDPAQQKVMMLMPLMFTYMFLGFPSGLVLYWLVNNVLTIGQQYLLLREQK